MLKLKKNKSFSYTPRFSKEVESNPKEKEVHKYGDFRSKWRNNQGLGNRKLKRGLSLPLLLLALVVILVCMYLLNIKAK